MADFSLLCAVQNTSPRKLKEMLNSLVQQTLQDYELVLIVGAGRPKDQAMVQGLLAQFPKARMVLRPNQETLAMSANALLPTLSSGWMGFIGHRDQLLPDALAAALISIAEHPLAKVVFTDEECRDALNRITQRFDKLSLNPLRLRSQEYLRDLALIDCSWLTQLGGFNPITSEWPCHDIYLKTLETIGIDGFAHIPVRLYQRFRIYRDRPADLRRRAHLPGFDTQAIKLHLQRSQIPAEVHDTHRGTVEIDYGMPASPWVQVYLIVDDGAIEAWRCIKGAVAYSSGYGAAQYAVVCTNPDVTVYEEIFHKAHALGLKAHHVPGNLPAWLNQQISRTDATYIALVRGEIFSNRWLKELLSHAQVVGAGVVGGKCITSRQLTWPGVLNHRYEGWDWNSRGKFNLLAITHNTGAVSSSNMLFSTQALLFRGGFDVTLPTLFGMEFCLRMSEAGLGSVCIPGATIITQPLLVPDAEAALFKGRWSAWSDQYKLILPW